MTGKLPENIIFHVTEGADRKRAEALSKRLALEISEKGDPDRLTLRLDEAGLSLIKGDLEMHGDLTQNLKRIHPVNLKQELLVKAAKPKSAGPEPFAVDATAGLGEDSLLLAAAGFRVLMFELDPVIAALLEDSLLRVKDHPVLGKIAARMQVAEEDSVTAMPGMEPSPDVVLLDPMFPARTKSALIKKKFQLLQQLERPCSEEAELLEAAFAAKPKRIVIKRPLKGPYLADKKPEYSLTGKAIRYDCFILHENIAKAVAYYEQLTSEE